MSALPGGQNPGVTTTLLPRRITPSGFAAATVRGLLSAEVEVLPVMPSCPTCGAAMSTVMRRRNEVVETRYECPSCKKEDTKRDDQRDPRRSGGERMKFEPEVSVITGKITHLGGQYIYVWPGTRITLQPGTNRSAFSVGMQVTVRALRRHGQYVAEAIELEATSDRPGPTPSG